VFICEVLIDNNIMFTLEEYDYASGWLLQRGGGGPLLSS
jgi:hypothetical protein